MPVTNDTVARLGRTRKYQFVAGGGGKGIRQAMNAEEFPNQFRHVQMEVPGSPIFIMKLAKVSRVETKRRYY
jgi:hypothetical protein